MLAVLAVALQIANEPRVDGGLSTMRMTPVTVNAALTEFDRLCLTAPFDRAVHRAAIATSAWRWRADPQGGPVAALSHLSTRGYAKFNDGGRLPQCNLDTATPQANGTTAVVARLELLLRRRLGTVPARVRTADTVLWQWPGSQDKVVRLYLFRRSGDDPRQLSFSLQRWPAALAAVVR